MLCKLMNSWFPHPWNHTGASSLTLPCLIFELPLSWSQSNKSTFSPDQPSFSHLQNMQLTFQFSVLGVSFEVSPCFFSREYSGIMLQDPQQPLHAWNDQQPLHGRVKNNPYLFPPLLFIFVLVIIIVLWIFSRTQMNKNRKIPFNKVF